MGEEGPKRRRQTSFSRPLSGTLGRMWQQPQRNDAQHDDWLRDDAPDAASQMPPQMPSQAQRRTLQSNVSNLKDLPPLPNWPPLPEEDRFSPGRPEETTLAQPLWDNVPRANHPAQRLRDLARRLWPATQRGRLALIAGAVAACVLIFAIVAAIAINNVLNPQTTTNPLGPLTSATGTISNTAASATSTASESATATTFAASAPTSTPPPVTLAITFTCASGTIGGNAQVCIQTAPNASVMLVVKYCDGSLAKGKGFHGSATADGNGTYTWQWTVTTHCAGDTTATVTAKSAGQTFTQSTTFTINRQ